MSVTAIPLLRAGEHCWSDGQVTHQLDLEQAATLCGRTTQTLPGSRFEGAPGVVTCRVCLRALSTREKHRAMTARWERDEQLRQEVRSAWQQAYAAYLESPTWARKRERVLFRAAGACEGCGCRQATEVHHLRYPRSCVPGSSEWVSREKLFDLVAVCGVCHGDIHRAAAS